MSQAKRKSGGGKNSVYLDPWLLGSALALAGLGLIAVASASVALADRLELPWFYFAGKHAVSLFLGGLLVVAVVRIPLANLERASPLLMLLSMPLLMLVFVPGLGVSANGSARWVNIGVLNFQVVEAVKLMLTIYLAGYLVRQSEALCTSFKGLVKPMLVAGTVAVLLLLQPDFGGALLVLAVTTAMVWQGGARLRDLLSMGVLALPILIWLLFAESYRLRRLKSFLDPWADPFDGGFQLTQALIAIGRGEWFGVGLGGSVQKLFYLPEAHSDFILAVLAEELGLLGVILVLSLFALLVGRGLFIAIQALERGQPFAGFLAYGLALCLGLQATISIGVNFGLLPTKGLTLPLVSAGGSSVLMTCLAVGLLIRVAHESAALTGAAVPQPRQRRRRA